MLLRTLALGAALALALGGCTITLPDPHPSEPRPTVGTGNDVTMTREQDGRFLAFVGPKQQHAPPFLEVDDTNYFALRSWLDTRNGEAAHQLYVEDSYFGTPLRWDAVHDANGRALRFIPISRNQITCEDGCSYADEFAAALPEDVLRAHRDSGLALTFTAATGKNLAITIPGRFIAEQLAALDATRTALAANGAPGAKATPSSGPIVIPPSPTAAPAAPQSGH